MAYVKSVNLKRRQLTGSQRWAAIVACSEWRPAHREKKSAATAGLRAPTSAQMAKEADVGVRTIEHAKAAHYAGVDDAVRDGRITAERGAQIAKLPAAERAAAVAAVLGELKRRCDTCLTSAVWSVLRDHIEADPTPYVATLGLEVATVTKPKKLRTMTEIFTSKGKGSSKSEPDDNPMGFAKPVSMLVKNQMGFTAPANDRTPSCVGFAPDTAPQPAPAAPQIIAIVDAVEATSPDVVRERDADFAAGTWDADTGEFHPAQVTTRSNKANARAWVAQAQHTVMTPPDGVRSAGP